jgi:hypothetical protein
MKYSAIDTPVYGAIYERAADSEEPAETIMV